ncbi:ATP-binding protein [Actinocorallia longicatena]|uniref:ATP-binding protein n=1 Tax=Actinocorallia longicatena TaxID=111803 RepID=A0ABP6QMM6_9ACTN
MERERESVSAMFGAVPEAAGMARDVLREALEKWEVRKGADDAALVLTELVTNAIRHGTTISVRVVRERDDALRLEVADGSRDLPRPRTASTEDEDGRGMLIVTALALDWGVRPFLGGKTVFALLKVG